MLMPVKVAVTGASGHIGNAVLERKEQTSTNENSQTIIAIELNDSTYVIGPDSSSISYGTHNIQLQKVANSVKRTFGKERQCSITLRVD